MFTPGPSRTTSIAGVLSEGFQPLSLSANQHRPALVLPIHMYGMNEPATMGWLSTERQSHTRPVLPLGRKPIWKPLRMPSPLP